MGLIYNFPDINDLKLIAGDRRPTRQEEEAAIMAGISRLCNLIAVSLRPYLVRALIYPPPLFLAIVLLI